MEHALDIHTRQRVDVVWAQKEYGPLLNDQDRRFPRFLCSACCGGMHVVRPAYENGTPHFAHHDGAICNAVEAGRLRYDNLRDPGQKDNVDRLKADFVQRWPWVFKRLNAIVGNLCFKEFIKVLDISVQRRAWEYQNLDVGQLPYVFALMIDFTRAGGFPKRAKFRRFWSLPGRPGDFWMWPEQASQLCRGEFATPRSGNVPGAAHLLDFDIIDPSRTYLNTRRPFINPKIVIIMERWLSHHDFPTDPR